MALTSEADSASSHSPKPKKNKNASTIVTSEITSKQSSCKLESRLPKPAPSTSCSASLRLFVKQLYALLWKCFISRRLHFISTSFEAMGPLLVPPLILAMMNNLPGIGTNKAASTYVQPILWVNPVFGTNFISLDFIISRPTFNRSDTTMNIDTFTVVYAPKNKDTDSLVASLTAKFTLNNSKASTVQLIGVRSDAVLRDVMSKAMFTRHGFLAMTFPILGLSFDENLNLSSGNLSFAVHRTSGHRYCFNYIAGQKYPQKLDNGPSKTDFWLYYRVIQVISYISRQFVIEHCKQSNDPEHCKPPDVRRLLFYLMPYPSYIYSSTSKISLADISGCVISVCYVLVAPIIVKRIADEKASKVKELFRMMGMSDLVFWASHFGNYILLIVFQAIVFLIIFFHSSFSIFVYSSASLFFVFFLFYGTQVILFSMTLSTLFSKPVVAVIATSIFWCLSVMGTYQYLVPSLCKCRLEPNNNLRRWTALLPMTSLMWFISIMGDFETKSAPLSWSTIDSQFSIYGDFTALSVFKVVILSCFMYAVLIFYLDNVSPFQPGVPKSPFFIFLPSYWCPKVASSKSKLPKRTSKYFEPQPKSATARIQIRDICKTFGKKRAVNHLWLDIYEKQLTVLLGHNGAGKTTTMNMITGMFSADSGSIFLQGYNVFTQTNEARRSIGLCPQENIYFNDLTVGQHLRMFALLKNYPMSLVNKEINYVLQLLALDDKRNTPAKSLSGGMKRKLQLGMAMIADTETLILDEPTSGMDPEARRVIWDLLISIRRKRTILLTTHYMEEADVLADQIAIMNEGKMCCSGSPIFLKTNFGDGYRLRVAKSDGFNSNSFKKVLQTYFPQGKLVSDVETEVLFSLAAAEKDQLLATIPKLFSDIDKNKNKYCIESCGLYFSTLEDVFLIVGADGPLKKPPDGADGEEKHLQLCSKKELLTGKALLASQVKGLFIKRLQFTRRYWPILILQIVIPAGLFAFGLTMSKIIENVGRTYTLDLNAKDIYGPHTETFFTSSDANSKYNAEYEELHKSRYDAHVSHLDAPSNDSVNMWLLERAKQSLLDYSHNYLYGVQMNDDGAMRLWFNNEQYHSLPLAVIALFETILRSVMLPELKNTVAINVRSVPVMSDDTTNLYISDLLNDWVGLCLVYLPLALIFLGTSFILFPIKEHRSKALQLMTGLSPSIFWTVNFVYDILTHFIATAVLAVIYLSFQMDLFGTGYVLFIFISAYGMAAIPLFYCLALLFTKPQDGFIFAIIFFFLFGLILNFVAAGLHMRYIMFLDSNASGYIIEIVDRVISGLLPALRFVPLFSLAFGFQKLFMHRGLILLCQSNFHLEAICKGSNHNEMHLLGCCENKCKDRCLNQSNHFTMGTMGTGTELLCLCLSALFYLLAVMLWEPYKVCILKIFTWPSCFSRKTLKETIVSIDSDVKKERDRVEKETSVGKRSDLLTVYKLRKTFGAFTAVKGISFGVRRNECFGFLGVNGAGKTTTFSMLTGDLVPTSGDAFIGPHSLLKNMNEFRGNLGYCPQFDSLLEDLTGEENLYLFARLRGVPQQHLKRDVDNLIEMLGLGSHRSRSSGTYSGGNKRKVSIAIALLGSPCLLLLDEPSAGVDPAARRKMWQTLGYIRRNLDCSIMLTSHSMEECEALCSRIGIMVSGTLRCLGSTQHLRHKFGQGYSVTIRLRRKHQTDRKYAARVKSQLGRAIHSAVLKDYHQCTMQFHITGQNETWSSIFATMNKLNDQFKFEDYTVSDTSLEQIFISFARDSLNEKSRSE